MADIELRRLVKRFGHVEVVAKIDLKIAHGEFVTLLGPSGCGKTTTLNMVAGVEEVSAGEILMNAKVVNDLTPFERDIAMVFQNYALYPHMTVAGNIGFTLRLRRLPKAEIRRKVAAVVEALELAHVIDRLPSQLSGGQQQRVAIGRAMVREPQAFLFDEPFSNLDAALRLRMRAEIKLLHQRLGTTSLFVTHDQEEALSLADRIAVMRQGLVEQYGTPEEIYSRPATRYVAGFIGSPAVDFVTGRVEHDGDRTTFRAGSISFVMAPSSAALLARSGEVELAARPEHVRVGDRGEPARVELVQPVGPASFVTLGWDGGTMTARVPGMSRLRPGQTVRLEVEPEHLMFFDKASGRRVAPAG